MSVKYAKGRVRRSDKDQLIRISNRQHKAHLQAKLAVPPPAAWDSRIHRWVGDIKNQQQCGSCWDFSGTGIVEIAYNKAGAGGGGLTSSFFPRNTHYPVVRMEDAQETITLRYLNMRRLTDCRYRRITPLPMAHIQVQPSRYLPAHGTLTCHCIKSPIGDSQMER